VILNSSNVLLSRSTAAHPISASRLFYEKPDAALPPSIVLDAMPLRSEAVIKFISLLRETKTFSFIEIKRRMNKMFHAQTSGISLPVKRDGNKVREMFEKGLMNPGASPLPTGSSSLRVEQMAFFHCKKKEKKNGSSH
jgi:hypothetical protein